MKRWKKIAIIAISLNLLFFSYDGRKREAEASAIAIGGGGLGAVTTLGGFAALSPYLLPAALVGLAGVAVGLTIVNWDVIVNYGQNVISKMAEKGHAVESYVIVDTTSVMFTDELKASMIEAYQDLPMQSTNYTVTRDTVGPRGFESFQLELVNPVIAAGTTTVFTNLHGVFLDRNPTSSSYQKIIELYITSKIFAGDSDNNHAGLEIFAVDRSGNIIGRYLEEDTAIYFTGGFYALNKSEVSFTYGAINDYGQPMTEIAGFGFVNNMAVDVELTNAYIGAYPGFEFKLDRSTVAPLTLPVATHTKYVDQVVANNEVISFSNQADLTNVTAIDLPKVSDKTLTPDQVKVITSGIPLTNEGSVGSTGTIIDTVTSIPGAIITGIGNLFSWLQGLLISIWNAILALPTTIVTGISSFFGWLQGLLTNIWSAILATPAAIVTGISSFFGWLQGLLTNIWNGVLAIPSAIVSGITGVFNWVQGALDNIWTGITSLVIPADMTVYTTQMNDLNDTFKRKFEFITIPIQRFKELYRQEKSLYDLSFTLMDVKVYPFPRSFSPVVDIVRPVLTGSVVLSSLLAIYRKVSPDEVV